MLRNDFAFLEASFAVGRLGAHAVPIMTIHGTKDLRVNYENALRLHEALKKAGTRSLLIPMAGCGHGIPRGVELSRRIGQFWDMHLRGVKSDISTEPIAVPAPKKRAQPPGVR